ncbi:MAG: hypothetical protein U0031_12250 [Thermomicrobiales bacterium]
MLTDNQPERAAQSERTNQAFQPAETVRDSRVGTRMIVPIVVVVIGLVVLIALFMVPR